MLSKEYQDKIKNYEQKIESMEDTIEAIRTIPTMYIGHVGNKGYLNMFREVFQNSTDEVMRKDSPCNHIWVTFDQTSYGVCVEDNGRGIPFSKMIDVYTKQHTSSNYRKEAGSGEYTSGTHGVGAKVTNALSSKFIVESYILGEARRVEFDKGRIWKEEIQTIENNNKQGTSVTFFPDYDIMGTITVQYEEILYLIRSIVPLTVPGTVVTFKAILNDGSTYNEEIYSEGTLTFLNNIIQDKYIEIIQFDDDDGTNRANIKFTYETTDLDSNIICGYSNFCPCIGVHIDAFVDALTGYFKKYMNKIYLVEYNKKKKKNPLTVVPSDIKAGLRAVIDVACIKPLFSGQAKEYLTNEDMKLFVKNLTQKVLDQWSKDNPTDLQKLCKRFKDIAETRESADKNKQKISMKYKETLSGFHPKFVKPLKSYDELIICEGDSAGGSMKNFRDNNTQGVFPIRGKIKNCITNPPSETLKNEEVRAIISLIDAGYGKSFDIKKARFKRVIIMTDADDDGAHIANLLLSLFITFMPDMIKEGRIYRAIPPLYKMGKGKNSVYFFDKVDYMQYLRDLFIKTNTIAYTKYNTPLDNFEILNILKTNEDYIYEMKRVSATYNVDIKLLEYVLINRDLSYDELIKRLKSIHEYRFLDINIINDTLAIKGAVNGRINTLFLNDKMYSECKNIINILENNQYTEYLLNGQVATIYDIMKIFNELEPESLQRFKGLGEMNADELAYTTVYPTENKNNPKKIGNRVLVQYTFEDVAKDIEKVRYLSFNKGEMLKDIKVSRSDIF